MNHIHLQLSDCGKHIRAWSKNAFEGSTAYAPAHQTAVPVEVVKALEEDAANWRALMSSARIRVMGAAGMLRHENGSAVVNPDRSGWVHLGLELWDEHPAAGDESDATGRAMLQAYVSHMRRPALQTIKATAA